MEKDELRLLEEVNQRSKSNTKRLDGHDKKIEQLENVYVALTEVKAEVKNVKDDVGEIKDSMKIIEQKANSPEKAKALKWDKLIDYIFYAILAVALFKLGLK